MEAERALLVLAPGAPVDDRAPDSPSFASWFYVLLFIVLVPLSLLALRFIVSCAIS